MQKRRRNNETEVMNDNVTRVSVRSLKEQFSRGSEAWREQSDPIFRFLAEGDWWGFPFFSLSASRYFGDKEILCLYWHAWNARHHRSEGAGFLRWVLFPKGNVSQSRWSRHHGCKANTQCRIRGPA